MKYLKLYEEFEARNVYNIDRKNRFDVSKSSHKGGWHIKYSSSNGKGRALIFDKDSTMSPVDLKQGEMYLFGIDTYPSNFGVGRMFLKDIFDYFNLDKIYLPSSDNHPVWNKLATKTDIESNLGIASTIYTLSRYQLYRLNEGFWGDRKKRRASNKALLKAESEVNKHISKFINQKYGFQYSVVVWTSRSSNYNEIDHDRLTFTGVEIEPTYYDNSDIATGAFFYLKFTDKNNDEVSIYFPSDAITQNEIDLEYAKPWDLSKKALRGDVADKEEDNVDYDDPNRYPKRDSHFVYVPSEYKTVELLTELKGLLQSINEQI